MPKRKVQTQEETRTVHDELDSLAADMLVALGKLSREKMTPEELVRVVSVRAALWGTTRFAIEELVKLMGEEETSVLNEVQSYMWDYIKEARAPKPLRPDLVCSLCDAVFLPGQLDHEQLCSTCAASVAQGNVEIAQRMKEFEEKERAELERRSKLPALRAVTPLQRLTPA